MTHSLYLDVDTFSGCVTSAQFPLDRLHLHWLLPISRTEVLLLCKVGEEGLETYIYLLEFLWDGSEEEHHLFDPSPCQFPHWLLLCNCKRALRLREDQTVIPLVPRWRGQATTHPSNSYRTTSRPEHKPSISKTAFNSPFRKFEYVKVPFGLAQAPAYFQELMNGILKDFPFTIACLDNIIIFSKTPQKHLSHICMVFEKLKSANLSMKKSNYSFFSKKFSI